MEELDCYINNADIFCPASTKLQVKSYSKNAADYWNHFFCKDILLDNWKKACQKDVHDQWVKNHESDTTVDPDKLFQLPKHDGPERACFEKLHAYVDGNHTKIDLEKRCMMQAYNKWDPRDGNAQKSTILESCCVIYDTLDCVRNESAKICSPAEGEDLDKYRKKSYNTLGTTLCQSITYEMASKECLSKSNLNSGSQLVTFSFILLSVILSISIFVQIV